VIGCSGQSARDSPTLTVTISTIDATIARKR
jgi:hypothetical protein